MTDKVPLSDDRLDLKADHVHGAEIEESLVQSYMNGDTDVDGLGIDYLFEEALNYTQLEGKDAVIVITIKAGK